MICMKKYDMISSFKQLKYLNVMSSAFLHNSRFEENSKIGLLASQELV